MSFLQKRRSLNPSQAPALPPSLPPPVENICVSTPSDMPLNSSKKSGSTNLIRRMSSLFGNRKKRPLELAPLPDIQAHKWDIRSDSPSPTSTEVSIDDIRRPSGLGRAVSISSNRSLPPSPFIPIDEESPFHIAQNAGYERSRALSSPTLFYSTGSKPKLKTRRRSSSAVHRPQKISRSFFMRIPNEILVSILFFLPRNQVATIAATSRAFRSAARITLYTALDFRTMGPKQIEALITLLAFRQDLAEVIRTFECHVWPSFFLPGSNPHGNYSPSVSPQLTATFTIAFQKMSRLTSLLLPSFDHTFLRHHSAFGLKSITFLNRSLSSSETHQLFTWLNGQTNINHLAFPCLVENSDPLLIPPIKDTHHIHQCTNNNALIDSSNATGNSLSPFSTITSSCTPILHSFPSPPSPFNSPNLLPALESIHAPAIIFTSLFASVSNMSPRPLKVVILNINSTLYTGLRPGALMNSLQGITRLGLRFGSGVDRRTIGKVLSAAGAALTEDGAVPTENDGLRELSIGVPRADQNLYKLISSVLPRFPRLLSLNLSVIPEWGEPNSSIFPALSPSPPIRELSDSEQSQVKLWVKSCPSLKTIVLLSGALWSP